jgi:phage/plasmid primase-like uncharacterized protein
MGNQNIEAIKELISIKIIFADAGIKIRGSRSDCPFCTGSSKLTFSVNESKGYGHCFRCGYSGDAFDLYQSLHQCNFKTALARLAEKCGITLSSNSPQSKTPKPLSDKDQKILSCRLKLRGLEKFREDIEIAYNAEIDVLAERAFIAQEIIDDVDRQFAALDQEKLETINVVRDDINVTRNELNNLMRAE